MKKLTNWLKNRWQEPSTKKGVGLVAAGVTLAIGHPELITASVTETGVQWGGLVGTAAPVLIGLWESVRREFNY